MTDVLREILENERLPACPVVLSSVIRVMQDPNGTAAELGKYIAVDQTLTGKLLGLVNSAFYGLKRHVYSVEEAALRLGFNEIWSLAVAAQMNDMYREFEGTMGAGDESLWQHSLKVGVMAKYLSGRTRTGSQEEAFTQGILHDFGKLALFCHDPDGFKGIHSGPPLVGPELVRHEKSGWNVAHPRAGAELLRHWGFPDRIASPIQHHHGHAASRRFKRESVLLQAADALARMSHVTEQPDGERTVSITPSDQLLTPDVEAALGLDEADRMRVILEAAVAFEVLMRVFQ